MKQEISELMDGELSEDQANLFFNRLKRTSSASKDWSDYQLIGDVLRQPDHITPSFMQSFHERLQDEPTVIAPRSRRSQRAVNFALSAVASVMALALVAWMALQIGNEPAPRVAAVEQGQEILPVSPRASEYLMAHQEFSPGSDMNGATSLIHAVAGQ